MPTNAPLKAIIFIITASSIFSCGKKESGPPPDSSKAEWQLLTTTNLPEAREECSFVLVGNKGYLIGGRGSHPVEQLDINSKTWSKLVTPDIELNHFQATALDGEIWMAGGFTGGFPHETPVENIRIFNPSRNEWRTGPEIPADRRRGSAGAVTRNGKLYLVAGILDGHWSGNVSWFDEYDPQTGKWKKLADAPHARDHFNAVLIGDKLFLAGGRRSSEITGELFDLTVPEIDVYDFTSGSWSTLPPAQNIPTQRAGCAAVNLNGNLVIIGGESTSQAAAHKETESFNIATSTWTSLKSLNTGRHGTQAFVVNGAVYITSGNATIGGGQELNSTEEFN